MILSPNFGFILRPIITTSLQLMVAFERNVTRVNEIFHGYRRKGPNLFGLSSFVKCKLVTLAKYLSSMSLTLYEKIKSTACQGHSLLGEEDSRPLRFTNL